jgi:putative phosphoribosyl transferase
LDHVISKLRGFYLFLGNEMIVHEIAPHFQDRHDAGQKLAQKLTAYQGNNTVVLAIPHGGVPIGIEIAQNLGAGLDLMVVRKIPMPSDPEAGYGAVTDDGTILLNEPLVARLGLTPAQIERQAQAVKAEIDQRKTRYQGKEPSFPLDGRTVFLVDDGLASGFTMLAAIESARRRGAGKVVVAVPVASASAFQRVEAKADVIISLIVAQTNYFAVAGFYYQWYDLTEKDVIGYLKEWRQKHILQTEADG